MTLAEFLIARLDEDERIARAAMDERADGEPEHWRWECINDDVPLDPDLAIASNEADLFHPECEGIGVSLRSVASYPGSVGPLSHIVINGEVRSGDARYLAYHDPARALRDVNASRAIIPQHKHVFGRSYFDNIGDNWGCVNCHDDDGLTGHPGWCVTLKALASVYSNHPDYDADWQLP